MLDKRGTLLLFWLLRNPFQDNWHCACFQLELSKNALFFLLGTKMSNASLEIVKIVNDVRTRFQEESFDQKHT